MTEIMDDGTLPEPLPCIKCSKQLESVFKEHTFKDEAQPQPADGVFFRSRGNYGSTVWDPGGISRTYDEYLEVIICDECLVAFKELILHVTTMPRRPTIEARPWKPILDDEEGE